MIEQKLEMSGENGGFFYQLLLTGIRMFRIGQEFLQILLLKLSHFNYFQPVFEHFSLISHTFSTISCKFGLTLLLSCLS